MEKLLEETILFQQSLQISCQQQSWPTIQDQLRQILLKDRNKYKNLPQKFIKTKTAKQKKFKTLSLKQNTATQPLRREKNSPLIQMKASTLKLSQTPPCELEEHQMKIRNTPLFDDKQKKTEIIENSARFSPESKSQKCDKHQIQNRTKSKTISLQEALIQKKLPLLNQVKKNFILRGNRKINLSQPYKQKKISLSNESDTRQKNQSKENEKIVVSIKNQQIPLVRTKTNSQHFRSHQHKNGEKIFKKAQKLKLCQKIDRIKESILKENNENLGEQIKIRCSTFEVFGEDLSEQYVMNCHRSNYNEKRQLFLEKERNIQRKQLLTDQNSKFEGLRIGAVNSHVLKTKTIKNPFANSAQITDGSKPLSGIVFPIKQRRSRTIYEKSTNKLLSLQSSLGKQNIQHSNSSVTGQSKDKFKVKQLRVNSQLSHQLKLTLKVTPMTQHQTRKMLKSIENKDQIIPVNN